MGGVYGPYPTTSSSPASPPASPPPEPLVFEEPKVEYLVDFSESALSDWELAAQDLIASDEASKAAAPPEEPAALPDWELAAHDLIAADEASKAAGPPAEPFTLPDWELAAHDAIAAAEAAKSDGIVDLPAGMEAWELEAHDRIAEETSQGGAFVEAYARSVGFGSSGGSSSNWGQAVAAADVGKQGVSASLAAFDFSKSSSNAPRVAMGSAGGWGALSYLAGQDLGSPSDPGEAGVATLEAISAAGDAQDLARALRPGLSEVPQLAKASGVASGGLALLEGANQLRLADGDREQQALGGLKMASGVLMMMAPIPVIGQGAFIAGSGLYTGVMLYENRETIQAAANGVPDWAYAVGMSMPGLNVVAMAGLGIKHADDLGGAVKSGAGKLNPFD